MLRKTLVIATPVPSRSRRSAFERAIRDASYPEQPLLLPSFIKAGSSVSRFHQDPRQIVSHSPYFLVSS